MSTGLLPGISMRPGFRAHFGVPTTGRRLAVVRPIVVWSGLIRTTMRTGQVLMPATISSSRDVVTVDLATMPLISGVTTVAGIRGPRTAVSPIARRPVISSARRIISTSSPLVLAIPASARVGAVRTAAPEVGPGVTDVAGIGLIARPTPVREPDAVSRPETVIAVGSTAELVAPDVGARIGAGTRIDADTRHVDAVDIAEEVLDRNTEPIRVPERTEICGRSIVFA